MEKRPAQKASQWNRSDDEQPIPPSVELIDRRPCTAASHPTGIHRRRQNEADKIGDPLASPILGNSWTKVQEGAPPSGIGQPQKDSQNDQVLRRAGREMVEEKVLGDRGHCTETSIEGDEEGQALGPPSQ